MADNFSSSVDKALRPENGNSQQFETLSKTCFSLLKRAKKGDRALWPVWRYARDLLNEELSPFETAAYLSAVIANENTAFNSDDKCGPSIIFSELKSKVEKAFRGATISQQDIQQAAKAVSNIMSYQNTAGRSVLATWCVYWAAIAKKLGSDAGKYLVSLDKEYASFLTKEECVKYKVDEYQDAEGEILDVSKCQPLKRPRRMVDSVLDIPPIRQQGKTACYRTCVQMMKENCKVPESPWDKYAHALVDNEDEKGGVAPNYNACKQALEYIEACLERRLPVIAGVSYKKSRQDLNHDLITDHFVLIIGDGTGPQGEYTVIFNDPATGKRDRFFIDSKTRALYCPDEVKWDKGSHYVVAQIRTHESLPIKLVTGQDRKVYALNQKMESVYR